MLKFKTNCKVCQAVKANDRLLKRIYDSKYYIPHSKDTLRQIQIDCQKLDPNSFSYLAILNHVKKHQHINAKDFEEKMLIQKAKDAELKIIEGRYESQHVQDAVINKGMQKLENGEMKLTTDHLLRAARDKQDGQAKRRDQQLQLVEMVAFFTSGADNQGSERMHDRRHITLEEYDPAIPVAEYSDTGA